MMNEDSPFKLETLLEQCGGNKDIAGVVLDEFIIQVADDMKEMETSISSGDLIQVGKIGHRLKGTAGVLGAAKLHALCFALETAGKGENAEEVAKIGPELKTEANRCVDAVPEVRGRL
ncbi:MAG: Hpt domain-containing protein [Planctomycetaceae bacterium]|nr:Hpt domain-containing protein [Planctomycetaceae bacterium]